MTAASSSAAWRVAREARKALMSAEVNGFVATCHLLVPRALLLVGCVERRGYILE